ncbi:DUF3558 family protein [Actinopolymorpha pittospori]|uniref:DUF3558 domain-containing protein n=1 Tax=Actinopolymorpha pittospori TaxID=648752 RepID=A0A927MWI2_9ACTN|nr:DUF3558 family protein [Actinopolymorpha pittospori]MBE1606058.1 hypothetical protein [Actinopolymorpha pittospori]
MRRTRTGRRPALLGVVVLAMTGLVGCGQDAPEAVADSQAAQVSPAAEPTTEPAPTQTPSPTPTPTPAAVDPCALVTAEEAAHLAGTPLNPAQRVRDTCTYTGPVTGPTAQVEVYLGDGAKKILDIDRQLGHELKPLPGVGDEAYAEDGAAFFQKSGLWVSIRLVRLNDPAENRKPLEEAARTAASRV